MVLWYVEYNFTKISDTNQINQYLDIKNYILKTECKHILAIWAFWYICFTPRDYNLQQDI